MDDFPSLAEYHRFADFIMRKARHIMDAESQSFINKVIDTTAKRVRILPKGTTLWRSQLDYTLRTESITDENGKEVDTYETEGPHPPDRMMPRRDRATEGRVNPKGIPCLYLSDDRDTAMTEARPWIGSYVTVSQFQVLRNLKVVDCTLDSKPVVSATILGEQPKPAVVEAFAWRAINNAFSKPVTRNDDIAEYAPTQVLAEAFRSAGYEGIVYGSRLGKGKTVALFDTQAAKQINAFLFQLEKLNPEYTEVANPYFLGDKALSGETGQA